MNPNRLALIAVLLLPSIAAPDAGAQTRQQRLDQATRHAADQAADEAAQQSADAVAAATEAAAADAADAAADAAAAAATAAADAWAADPYNDGGYDSMTKALAIFQKRGSPADERWISVVKMPKGLWRSADLRTAKVEGNTRTIWEIIPNPDGGSFRTQQKYDCAQGTFTMLVLVSYYENGRSETSPIAKIEPRTPVPGTLAESMFDWVCAK